MEYGAIRVAVADWQRLDELMTSSQRALADASTAALPPSAQAAGSGFLSAWSDYAGESAAIAGGFADALEATWVDVAHTDGAGGAWWDLLNGRLGPSRWP
jgi:hypothetical protein